jgi:hypothetical protein
MFSRRLTAGLLACVAVAACSDNTTSPSAEKPATVTPDQRPARTGPLVFQLTDLAVRNAAGVLGTFTGTATITSFSSNAAGDLLATGTLAGNTVFGGVTTAVSTAFTNLVVTPGTQRCTILNLDLGPIFLNLLGLELVTSPISVDLTAVAGPGNLLGNLLCAVVHLLDQNPLSAAVTNLLNQINAILGAL